MKREGKMIVRRVATTLAVLMLTMMAFTVQTAWAEDEPFTANLENFAVSSFLENETYTEDKPSQVTHYIGISSGRLDHPNYVSITVPENNAALTVTVSHDAGYSNPETFTFAAGTTLCKIYNLVPQKIYYYKVEAGDEILKQGQFTTEGHLRMIMTETGFNIRDLGGWATVDEDNRTAYGKLFRGGELNYGHTVSAADLAELRRLGIGAELDLRRNAECNNTEPTASALGSDVDYKYMNQDYDDLTLGNDNNKNNIKDAFGWVLGKLRDDKAVYFHCSIGADRTGMYALVFGGLCGMTFDQLCKDYELTSFSEAGTRQWDSDGVNTLKTNLNYIMAQPGNTLQMKFYNYMYREVGVSASDLTDYIRLMTDGESSILNSNLAFNNKDNECIQSLSDITAICAAGSEVVNGAKAQLSDGTTTTDVQMSIDGIIITFSGVDLEPNKEYTLTIPAGAIEKYGIENAGFVTLTFNTSAEVTIRTWAGLKAAVETATTENPVSIELEGDITRNADEAITVTGKVTLDLNGKKIDGNNKNSIIFIVNTGGDLTITDLSDDKDGEISGAHGSANIYITETGKVTLAAGTIGGTIVGVSINMSGSFTMNGGTINTGNSITGFGVELLDNSSFTMNGGTITGNVMGVDIQSADATFTVSGDVNITGNGYENNGKFEAQDVRLNYDYDNDNGNGGFNPICIGGNLSPSARIGVKGGGLGEGEVKPFTRGLPGKGTKSNFVLNDANDPYYMDTAPNGELALIHPLELPKDNKENYLITGGIYFYREGQDETDEDRKRKAIIDASSIETLCIPTNIDDDNWSDENDEWFDEDEDGVEVWGVAYDRTFNPGKASTVMLPFSYNIQSTEGGAFYRFIGVYQEDGKWVAMMDGQEKLQANTPYLFVPDEVSTTMSFPGINYDSPVRLTTEGGGGQKSIAGNWVFQGTYEALKWTAGSTDGKTKIVRTVVENNEATEVVDEEEGYYYGFAATRGKATDGETDVEVGQFVQVAPGASIKPTRAYLKFTGGANARGAAAAEELPKTISVRLVKKGEIMGIPTPDPSRAGGEDGYYTLSGQRLTNGQKPTAKGLYIINGRKEVVK